MNQAVNLPPARVGELLGAEVERHFGPARLSGLQRLSGGASRETWSFDVETAAGAHHRLILRRDPIVFDKCKLSNITCFRKTAPLGPARFFFRAL